MSGPDDSAPEANTGSTSSVTRLQPLSRRRWWWLGGGVLLAGALVASWFALPIRSVEVMGKRHLSAGRVRELAGLNPRVRLAVLRRVAGARALDDPWVARR